MLNLGYFGPFFWAVLRGGASCFYLPLIQLRADLQSELRSKRPSDVMTLLAWCHGVCPAVKCSCEFQHFNLLGPGRCYVSSNTDFSAYGDAPCSSFHDFGRSSYLSFRVDPGTFSRMFEDFIGQSLYDVCWSQLFRCRKCQLGMGRLSLRHLNLQQTFRQVFTATQPSIHRSVKYLLRLSISRPLCKLVTVKHF